MSDPRNELVRLGPGIYRRGRQYIVRYRDPNGRQRQRTVDSRREAEMIRFRAQIERRDRREDDRARRMPVVASGMRPADTAVVRLSDLQRRSAAPPDPRQPWPAADWRRARSGDGQSPEA